MATKSMSAKDVRECAVKLQDDFLRAHAANPDMDERDILKVRNTIKYVEKFVRHNRANHEKAFQHMVESLTWRKSFGVNDIKFEDIDESLWQSGMALNHGYDVTGQNVVILCISKHRKDPKKAAMLRKWIAFSYETHQRLYPNNKMCMVFDMNGAGLSNMDMDLVRFVVNCFKIYFPDLLEWLLVYNMPWILQAAWKIVQSWLSDGAAAKVKFVTNDTIQEYIPAHNLLVRFGGQDTWEYDYSVERESMLALLRQAEDKHRTGASGASASGQGGAAQDDERGAVEEDDKMADLPQVTPVHGDREVAYESGLSHEELNSEASVKQVRFSNSLPPSSQSRFGDVNGEEEDYSSLGGPDQSLLKKGSATSLGFRRRQVTRLMSLQEGTPTRATEHGGRERQQQRNGSLPAINLEQELSEASGVAVGDIILSPPNELVFAGKKDSDVFCTITLKNAAENSAAYKIKTTAPLRYKVRPNLSLIDPKSIAKVQVMLIQGSEIKTAQDKFLVQTHTFPDPETVPKLSDLPMYWKALPVASIKEHRMWCRWMTDIPSRSVISPRGSISRGGGGGGGGGGSNRSSSSKATSSVVTSAGARFPEDSIDQKIQKLLISHGKLSESLTRLQRLNYAIMAILVLFLLTIIFF